MSLSTPRHLSKAALGHAAAKLVENDMLVGLGTGSTAACFIDSLIRRCDEEHLHITTVATSKASAEQASKGGIKVLDLNDIDLIDITIDGADEVDSHKSLIKGGGGALFREKMVALSSRELIIIVEQHKLVKQLGKFPLPVEIIPFGYKKTMERLIEKGYHPALRLANHAPVVTDNGNYIVDLTFHELISDPKETDRILKQMAGVVETGLFVGLTGRLLVALPDGKIETR